MLSGNSSINNSVNAQQRFGRNEHILGDCLLDLWFLGNCVLVLVWRRSDFLAEVEGFCHPHTSQTVHQFVFCSVCLGLFFIYGSVILREREHTKGLFTMQSLEEETADFFSLVSTIFLVFAVLIRAVGPITHRAEMQQPVQEDQWLLVGGVMLILTSFYASILLPCAPAEKFLLGSMLCVPAIICIVFVRSAPRAEDLEDFSVAMRLNKGSTNGELFMYYFGPAVEMSCDFVLFSSVGFKSTIPWGQSVPVSKFAVLESFQEMVTSDPTVLSALLTSMLAAYYLWGVVTIGAYLFPITRPKLKVACMWISFGLYVPLFLSITRIFLLGVQCRDGELIWDATPCNGAERHQLWIIVVLHGVTWCIGVATMCYADSSQREYDPYVATSPMVDQITLFLRFCYLVASAYLEEHDMLIVGSLLPLVFIGIEVNKPKFIGLPELNGTRMAFICGAAEVCITSLINFTVPDSWVGFVVMLMLFLPSVYLGYRIGRARTATQAVDKLFEEAQKVIESTQINSAPRVLGCVMHTQYFQKHLQDCLGDDVVEARKVHPEIDTNVAILDQLEIGLGTHCGRRAMEKYPSAVRPLLSMVSEYPDKTLAVTLKLASITSLLPVLREEAMRPAIDAWLSQSDDLQETAAEVILRIRGGQRIVVHYGDRLSGVHRVDVPRGAVWLVPNCPAVSDSKLVDAILAFPPTTVFPATIPNVHRLLIPTPGFDDFEPLAPLAQPRTRRPRSFKDMIFGSRSVATDEVAKLWILCRLAESTIPDQTTLREAFAAFYLGRMTPWVPNA